MILDLQIRDFEYVDSYIIIVLVVLTLGNQKTVLVGVRHLSRYWYCDFTDPFL